MSSSGATAPAEQKPQGSVLRQAARGGALLGAGQALATVSSSLITLILARLLTPADFGLAGMATVILGFLSAISDLGLTAALIQRKELDEAHKDAAFWSSMAMGAGLFTLCAGCAPLLAVFYREPRVTGLVVVAAASLLLGPLWSTHASLLRRELKFRAVAGIEVGRTLTSGATSIIAAAAGLGTWSILVGPIASHIFAIPAYRYAERGFRPGLRGTRRHARELFSFSLYVSGASAVNYLSANVDYLVVGRMLGPGALGTYTLAYQIMTFPLTRISTLFHQAMFPAFAAIQDQLDEMRRTYLGMSRALALVSFPILAWVAVVAPELLALVYGPQWLPAVPILRLLSVAGAMKSVGTLVGIIYKSRGKAYIELYWNLFWCAVLSIGVVIGVRWGSVGVAATISMLCVPGVLYTEWLACKIIEMPFRRLLGVLALPAGTALLSTAAGFAARGPLVGFLPSGVPWLVLRLVVLTAVMAATYAGSLRLLSPGIVAEARTFLAHFRKER